MTQISHLQQQLVGQVIDSHFSIYLFTGYVGTEKELLFHMVYGMVLAMVVTAIVKVTFLLLSLCCCALSSMHKCAITMALI